MPFDSQLLLDIENNVPTVTKVHDIGRGHPFVITSDDVKKLVAAIQKNNNPYVKTILLYDNEIDDTGAEALSRLSNIDTLALDNNKVTNRGALALARMPELHKLDLDGNDIGDAGFKALIQHPTLTTLSVVNNPISKEAAALALQNKTLTELLIENNQIDRELLQRIDAHIESNKPKNTSTESRTAPVSSLSYGAALFSRGREQADVDLKIRAVVSYAQDQLQGLAPEEAEQLKRRLIEGINALPTNNATGLVMSS